VQEFVFSVVSLLRIELIEEITAHQSLFNLGFSVIYMFNTESYVLWTSLRRKLPLCWFCSLDTGNKHMKLGITCILLACFQASNGLARPKKATPGEHDRLIRKIWVYLHQ
jgi:hypothetical protein